MKMSGLCCTKSIHKSGSHRPMLCGWERNLGHASQAQFTHLPSHGLWKEALLFDYDTLYMFFKNITILKHISTVFESVEERDCILFLTKQQQRVSSGKQSASKDTGNADVSCSIKTTRSRLCLQVVYAVYTVVTCFFEHSVRHFTVVMTAQKQRPSCCLVPLCLMVTWYSLLMCLCMGGWAVGGLA